MTLEIGKGRLELIIKIQGNGKNTSIIKPFKL